MARLARVVAPNYPHHIIQRGNRRQDVFFCDADKELYIDLLRKNASKYGLEVLAYCLMSNHVHLIAIPRNVESLGKGIGETHKWYTATVNRRNNWNGYLWQGRFMSFVLDEKYLQSAIRYVELNPVKAKIVQHAQDYKWSSARAHILGKKDMLCDTSHELVSHIDDWEPYLSEVTAVKDNYNELFEKHSQTGRPLGDDTFMRRIEDITGRPLKKQKPGPKKKELSDVSP
ncbi:MAG: transposase [Candidatus Auribacter fodinae]|jgi:putative transposase|uniref:Transposase n=1 Tax=Candidatus Auribacter fodinae TaxID=2093366 RepID=A0A3A4QYD1_9BACT|nr:MAG: transposase [Candidatus Auribacter fodinae]